MYFGIVKKTRTLWRSALIGLSLIAAPALVTYADHTEDLASVAVSLEQPTDSDSFSVPEASELLLEAELGHSPNKNKPSSAQMRMFVDGELALRMFAYEDTASTVLELDTGNHTLSAELTAPSSSRRANGSAVLNISDVGADCAFLVNSINPSGAPPFWNFGATIDGDGFRAPDVRFENGTGKKPTATHESVRDSDGDGCNDKIDFSVFVDPRAKVGSTWDVVVERYTGETAVLRDAFTIEEPIESFDERQANSSSHDVGALDSTETVSADEAANFEAAGTSTVTSPGVPSSEPLIAELEGESPQFGRFTGTFVSDLVGQGQAGIGVATLQFESGALELDVPNELGPDAIGHGAWVVTGGDGVFAGVGGGGTLSDVVISFTDEGLPIFGFTFEGTLSKFDE
jgi:hypothetical protein